MPVFSGHFTIAHLIHQPQAITENIDTFLHLASDFGSDWSVLYNGSRCGASAPDHLHFQAIPSGNMPIEKEIMNEKRMPGWRTSMASGFRSHKALDGN